MLTSSKNIRTKHPECLTNKWAPHGPVKLTHKSNHHKVKSGFRRLRNELDIGEQEKEESKMTPKE